MGSAENRAKASAQAAFMKERGIMRRTGQCPLGCGATYATSASGDGTGASLLLHLNKCLGGGARRLARLRNAGRR